MWQEKNKQLYRHFEFDNFKQAFEFMGQVADLAEAANHHPKWQNEYNKVDIWLSSHDAGKVTDRDRQLASKIDKIYGTPQAKPGKLTAAKLFTDGGSRGNPGHSAIAFVICSLDDNVVEKYGSYIGVATNNQAEYQALLAGLQRAHKLGLKQLEVFMDSELVVKQINGIYKIKHNDLKPIHAKITSLIGQFKSIKFVHVPRAMNKGADAEVNRILDLQAGKKA